MLKEIRVQKGLTQEELARCLNISPVHLSKIETGRRKLTIQMAARIASRLDCELSDLLDSRHLRL
ncbi:helix-turn-helix transcriptional regulator [Bacillus infantis]|uniref:helix-turn-helix transcriptional regulator n=1 Tax=Bacillus infantis TaxID=324767 RepID=UPI003B846977